MKSTAFSAKEGGRRTPVFNGYGPEFFFRTMDVTGMARLPADTKMVMPGGNGQMKTELFAPVAMDKGLRFAIWESGVTMGVGVVTELVSEDADSVPQTGKNTLATFHEITVSKSNTAVSNRLESTLPLTRILTLAFGSLAAASPAAFACSCSNNVPVQKTHPQYQDRAVFKARVTQFLGRTGGTKQRYSDRALAVVNEQYWGLPWYWPKVVILDGHGVCGFGFVLEEEYLIVGLRTWYGTLDVDNCSGSRPLRDAQVDLRTLDGSRCAGPGGSLFAAVRLPEADPGLVLTFRDSNGKPYTARPAPDGVYELRHLPQDRYTLDSRVSATRYVSMSAEVNPGLCAGYPVPLQPYSLTGRLVPGMWQGASIAMVDTLGKIAALGTITPDGRFYFDNVPPGEHLLAATFFLTGPNGMAQVYYPGVKDPGKATLVKVPTQPAVQSFDFDPETLPLVPMPIVVTSPGWSGKSTIVLQDSLGNAAGQWQQQIGIPLIIPGTRGKSYGVLAIATREQAEDPDLRSALIPLQAVPGRKTTVLSLIPAPAKPEAAGEARVR